MLLAKASTMKKLILLLLFIAGTSHADEMEIFGRYCVFSIVEVTGYPAALGGRIRPYIDRVDPGPLEKFVSAKEGEECYPGVKVIRTLKFNVNAFKKRIEVPIQQMFDYPELTRIGAKSFTLDFDRGTDFGYGMQDGGLGGFSVLEEPKEYLMYACGAIGNYTFKPPTFFERLFPFLSFQ